MDFLLSRMKKSLYSLLGFAGGVLGFIRVGVGLFFILCTGRLCLGFGCWGGTEGFLLACKRLVISTGKLGFIHLFCKFLFPFFVLNINVTLESRMASIYYISTFFFNGLNLLFSKNIILSFSYFFIFYFFYIIFSII